MARALRAVPFGAPAKKSVELTSQRWLNGLAKAMAKGSMPRGFFVSIYTAAPMERVDLIKAGIDAELASVLAKALNIRREQLIDDLGFARATIARKARNKEKLSTEQTERIVGLIKLIGQAETMVAESGNPEGFNAAQWVGGWIQQPNPALGKRRPADLMDTVQGQEIVSNLLLRMQTGAYA